MPRKYKGISEKLLPGYSYPFKVIEKLSFCIFKVESLEWNNKKVVLQRSITFLKKLKGQQVLANQEVEQKTNFTEKDFALTHEYEETGTMEGVADREVGIRHTNSEGVTLVTHLDGTQKVSQELSTIQNDEEGVVGFDPNTNQWVSVPNLPK